jgi:IclR family transcriptional regulator, KDG regulon repressor
MEIGISPLEAYIPRTEISDASTAVEGKLERADGVPATLGNLLRLIEELAQFDSVGVTRIAQHLQIPAANAYRLLRVLEKTGFVEQLPRSKQYRLTLKVFELGCEVANRTTIRDIAAVEMERIAVQSALAVNLGMLVEKEVLYLDRIQTDDILVVNFPPGHRAPAHCTAMGKAMLAFYHRSPREVLGEGPYEARTPHTITTLERLEQALTEIRQKGYAVDRQEHFVGIWCVGAPIISSREEVLGAISLTTFAPAIDEGELERLGSLVIMAARRIAARSGHLGAIQRW